MGGDIQLVCWRMRRIFLLAAWVWMQGVQAQVGLPSPRLPALPTGPLDRLLQQPVDSLETTGQDARKVRIRDLLHRHRDVLEADPKGAPIVRGEVLIYAPSAALMSAASASGFQVLRTTTLDALGVSLVVFHAPGGMSTARAQRQLKTVDPTALIDFNHLYTLTATETLERTDPQAEAGRAAPSSTSNATAGTAVVRVGLIDGGVDRAHRVFNGMVIHQHGCAGKVVPSAHGTAVASLMAGRTENFAGAAAGAELFAADVYCGEPAGGALDAILEAFDWLVQQRVPVLNVSLVGPPNVMLQAVVGAVVGRGTIIVAAVGNDGPAAPPLYPAAYPDVVGVTAVDGRRKVLLEAGRGPHVKFAAPGADMAAADLADSFAVVRGTSFAAPIVAGLLAAQMVVPDSVAARGAVADLARRAIDLGAPGPDVVYGYGLVGADVHPGLTLARESRGRPDNRRFDNK